VTIPVTTKMFGKASPLLLDPVLEDDDDVVDPPAPPDPVVTAGLSCSQLVTQPMHAMSAPCGTTRIRDIHMTSKKSSFSKGMQAVRGHHVSSSL